MSKENKHKHETRVNKVLTCDKRETARPASQKGSSYEEIAFMDTTSI